MVNIPPRYWIFLTLFTGLLSMAIVAGVAFYLLYEPPGERTSDGATPTVVVQQRPGPEIDLSRLPREAQLGVAIPLIVRATDDNLGMQSITLFINGVDVSSPRLLEGQVQAQVNYAWIPRQLGPTRILVQAVSLDEGALVSQQQITINVVEPTTDGGDESIQGFELVVESGDDPFSLVLDYGICPDQLIDANPELAAIGPGAAIFVPTSNTINDASFQRCESQNLFSVEVVNFFSNRNIGVHRANLNRPYPINPRYSITPGRGFECSAFFTGVDGQNSTYNCPPERPFMHTGIDVGAESGEPLYSISAGRVVYAGSFKDYMAEFGNNPDYTDDCNLINGSEPPHEGYGNFVIIQDANDRSLEYIYAHLSVIRVERDDLIDGPGFVIGDVGSTGCSTDPHLHFEVRRDGRTFDPVEFLEGLADETNVGG